MAVLDHLLAQATPTTTVPGPVIQLQGPRAIVLVVAIGVAIAVLWSLPIWLDARRAYKLRERAVELVGGKLLDVAAKDGLKITELRELLATIGEPATGQRGLSRALMAFTIITVIGVALVALLLSGSVDSGDLRKTVLTALLSILATIVGFYFGTRAAETGAEQAPPAPTAAATTTPAAGTAEAAGAAGAAEASAAGAEEAVPATEEPTAPATEEPTAPATEEPTAPATEEPTAPATEEPTAPATEEPAAPVAEDDPEEQLEAGLTEAESSPEELDRQVAAEHGELAETEVDYEAPDEEDLQPDDTDDEAAKEQP